MDEHSKEVFTDELSLLKFRTGAGILLEGDKIILAVIFGGRNKKEGRGEGERFS